METDVNMEYQTFHSQQHTNIMFIEQSVLYHHVHVPCITKIYKSTVYNMSHQLHVERLEVDH